MFTRRSLLWLYEKIPDGFDIILRLPLLAVLDIYINYGITYTYTLLPGFIKDASKDEIISVYIWIVLEYVMPLLVSIVIIFLIFLMTEHLLEMYAIMGPAYMVWKSYKWNKEIALQFSHQNVGLLNHGSKWFNDPVLITLVCQAAMSFLFNCLIINNNDYDSSHRPLSKQILITSVKLTNSIAFSAPFYCILMRQNLFIIQLSINLSTLFLAVQIVYFAVKRSLGILTYFRQTTHLILSYLDFFGLRIVIEAQWERLHVPDMLSTFWFLKIGYVVFDNLLEPASDWNYYTLSTVFRNAALVSGAENILSLLAMSAVVSTFYDGVVQFFKIIAGVTDAEETNFATTAAVLYFLLAMQTGVIELMPELRIDRLSRNIILITQAMFRFMHGIARKILLTLSAGNNNSLNRHIGPLIVYFFISIFSVIIIGNFWRDMAVPGVRLSVPVFAIEIQLKIFFALLQYTLLMIDSRCETVWLELDDYIFWTKSSNNFVEFAISFVLFCNALYIFVESGGIIRAFAVCMHAYFNIYRRGWKGVMAIHNRRLAEQKIASLPDATEKELADLSDICPVCYSDMTSAKVTNCGHFYHAACLRRWLGIRQTCPMCHQSLFSGAIEGSPPVVVAEGAEEPQP